MIAHAKLCAGRRGYADPCLKPGSPGSGDNEKDRQIRNWAFNPSHKRLVTPDRPNAAKTLQAIGIDIYEPRYNSFAFSLPGTMQTTFILTVTLAMGLVGPDTRVLGQDLFRNGTTEETGFVNASDRLILPNPIPLKTSSGISLDPGNTVNLQPDTIPEVAAAGPLAAQSFTEVGVSADIRRMGIASGKLVEASDAYSTQPAMIGVSVMLFFGFVAMLSSKRRRRRDRFDSDERVPHRVRHDTHRRYRRAPY